MPRIKKATDASGNVFYPASISKAIWDIDNNQRLSETITELQSDKADSSHTHTLSLAADNGTSDIMLQANTTYKLTAGGDEVVFTTPAAAGGGGSVSVQVGSSGNPISPSDGVITLPAYETNADVTDAENVKAALGTDSTHGGAFLRKDGTWQIPPDNNDNTTYGLSIGTGEDSNKIVLTPSNGTADKITVPYASNAGTVNGKTVAENVPSGAVFTDTTYSVMGASGSTHASGLVPDTPSTAGTTKYLREDGSWQTPPNDNTTYNEASTSAAGLMSATDKTKLDGIATGATANTGTVTGVTVGTGGTNYTPTNGVVTIPAYPTTLPASDVSSWAKASTKPSYAYSEISYTVNTASVSGAVSIDGSIPMHVLTVTGNVSSVALTTNPDAGHSCHVIFYAASAYTVEIAHDATDRVCPEAIDVSLEIPAGGYAEVDFLSANSKVYVRGV